MFVSNKNRRKPKDLNARFKQYCGIPKQVKNNISEVST